MPHGDGPASVNLLDNIIARDAEVRTRLRELLERRQFSNDIKTTLVVAYVDTALEHHEAIGLLAKSQLYGSAFAFVRLVWDAMLRALWINKVADPEQIEQASRDELKWRMDQVHIDVKQSYFGYTQKDDVTLAEQADECFERVKEVWKAGCSYTHSGALQLARRFTFDEMKPNYTEHEIVEALRLATMAHLFLLPALLLSMGYIPEADGALAVLVQYSAHFKECPPTD